MGTWVVVRPGWWFEVGCAVAAAALAAVILPNASGLPPAHVLLPLVLLLVVAENGSVLLPTHARVSPSFMIVMTAIAAFPLRTAVAGACVVGVMNGLDLNLIAHRKFTTALFNGGQYLLASAAAAGMFVAVDHGSHFLLAGMTAAITFAFVNVTLVTPTVALNCRTSARSVWADLRPQLPNYLAFGVLGVFVGKLHMQMGIVALPLVFVPALIARATFSSYLELRRAHEAAVNVFVRAIEAKDRYTAGHCERVARYAAYIGEELGFSPGRMEHLRYAALMHDVGKLAVPSSLLNKPGRLTADEYALVQRHNDVCIDILTRVDFLRTTVPAASDRHAHYGRGEERSDPEALEAYAIAVADAFDAMTSTRSYRRALPQDVAFSELRDKAGSQFHPRSVESLISAIERRGETYGDGHEIDVEDFGVAPPAAGVGSAGLGDLLEGNPAQP